MTDRLGVPAPTDSNFDFWARATALDAAARVVAGRLARVTGSVHTAPQETVDLAAFFEKYLINGRVNLE